MTRFGRVTRGPTLIDLCGRMLRSVVEGTWVRPDIPPANSADNVDKNKWLFRVGPYAKIRTAQGGAVTHVRLTTFSLLKSVLQLNGMIIANTHLSSSCLAPQLC